MLEPKGADDNLQSLAVKPLKSNFSILSPTVELAHCSVSPKSIWTRFSARLTNGATCNSSYI